ncbi:MAG: hypothetical protein JXB47_08735 [Anaerolineae bacterium]|nr:hypothetical protein [Anaerolineae bacterium]
MSKLTRNVCYYGEDAPLPESVVLHAGPLSMVYENGELRDIRLGEHEILRRVYVAVRDPNWGTVAPQLSNVEMDIHADSFAVRYEAENKQGDIDFFWVGAITGAADGTITFKMAGAARATFKRNRIGFCILHPMQLAGRPCTVTHVDGSTAEGVFPGYIAPHQPFKNLRAIAHEVVPGVRAEVLMEGDTFEMEDQRNWTDASYKTYCTPLELPFPATVKKGTKIAQSVTLKLSGAVPASTGAADGLITFEVSSRVTGPVPRIGLGIASHGRPLSEAEAEALQRLSLNHLRVDVRLNAPDAAKTLRRAAREAGMLDIELEVALHLTNNAESELKAFRALLDRIMPPVGVWLIFHVDEPSTTEMWVKLARKYLTDYNVEAQFGAGTDAFFTELNRDRPPAHVLDLVTYSINPQVHASDNASLVETLAAQAVTLRSARQFSGSAKVIVSPVTLKMRFNPAATGPEPRSGPGELPPQVDPRQMSLFGAGWTAGSLKYLAEGGAYSVTFYETTGWRGVMETEAGSPLPDKFPSRPGAVFPLYYVLADVGAFASGAVMASRSSDPLRVDGLALRYGKSLRVILANYTPETQRVIVRGLRDTASIRSLDETNVEDAVSDFEAYHLQTVKMRRLSGDILELDLMPFAVTRIDSEFS